MKIKDNLISAKNLVKKGFNKFKKPNSHTDIIKILSDDDRYKVDKMVIEEAIRDSDIETLEDMLHSSTSDFPDLIEMIKDAIEEYNDANIS